MRQPKNFREYGQAGCCPAEWNHTPDMTGDYVTDGAIQRCRNQDARSKLSDHLVSDEAYKINNGYGRGPVG